MLQYLARVDHLISILLSLGFGLNFPVFQQLRMHPNVLIFENFLLGDYSLSFCLSDDKV